MRNEVQRRRLERGFTQARLGELAGVSRQTINSIESGRYLPSLPLAFTLASVLDTTIERLFIPDEGADR